MFSHFILPGSVRIASTKYTEQIDMVAYKTPEKTIVVLLLNKTDAVLPVNVRMQNMTGSLMLPAGALAVCEIER